MEKLLYSIGEMIRGLKEIENIYYPEDEAQNTLLIKLKDGKRVELTLKETKTVYYCE